MVSEHASPLAAPGGPDSGGQNVHVRELSLALAAVGHRVTVLTRRDSPDLPEVVEMAEGVQVRHVTAGPPARVPKDRLVTHVPKLAGELERIWRAEPPDLVHAHFWMSGLAALAAVRGLDVPLVQTFHALGHVKRRHQGAGGHQPDRAAVRRAGHRQARRQDRRDLRGRAVRAGPDGCAAAQRGDRAVRGGRGHLQPGRAVADPHRATPAGDHRPAGAAQGRGRRDRRAGPGADAELLVAGGPPPGDDLAEDPDLKRLHGPRPGPGWASGCGSSVRSPARTCPRCCARPTRWSCAPWYEPFGMVPLEAMACGRAVVATAVGGMQDSVVDRVTGVHVPPRQPVRLGHELRGLLADQAMPVAYGIAGRDRVLSRYTWSRVAAATEAVYREVLDTRAAARDRVGSERATGGSR
jgi:glycosyltransferase involved in cell wall biosynthesis